MPIFIVRDKERFAFRISDDDPSVIYYRRIPPTKRAELVAKHTMMGEVNNLACQVEMCEYCVVGWEQLYDYEGNEITFSSEEIKGLPTEIILRVMTRINESSPEQAIKNWQGRSRNGSS